MPWSYFFSRFAVISEFQNTFQEHVPGNQGTLGCQCGNRRVRLCLPSHWSTLVTRWVDSDIHSSVGSNPNGSSHDRWCQKFPALTANWLHCTIPAWNFWVDGYPGESQGGTAQAAVSQLRERGVGGAHVQGGLGWVECWTADWDIRSGMGSNPSGGSHDTSLLDWRVDVFALGRNYVICPVITPKNIMPSTLRREIGRKEPTPLQWNPPFLGYPDPISHAPFLCDISFLPGSL